MVSNVNIVGRFTPARVKLEEFERILEEVKGIFDESKKNFLLLNNNYGLAKERIEDELERLSKQKLYEIGKMEEQLMKIEHEDNSQMMALIVSTEDTEKMIAKLRNDIKISQTHTRNLDTYVGYS